MNVVVTGGGGFLGQRLLRALAARGTLTRADGRVEPIGRLLSVDREQPASLFVHDLVEYVRGDISTLDFLGHVLGNDTASVFHLAAAPSARTEADFDLGMAANLDATRALLEACRMQRARPRFVLASSVAVYGLAGSAVVGDATLATPSTSYATQKLICELLLADYSRKGFVDGRALRLPSIVVRPASASEGPAGFASSIIREPLDGADAVCPVEPQTALWLASPAAAVAALAHAHELPEAAWGAARSLNAPGVTVTVEQMLQALQVVGGESARTHVRFEPDPVIAEAAHTWPSRFDVSRARALGFPGDPDFLSIVRRHAAERALAVSASRPRA